MRISIAEKVKSLGLTLPVASSPVANFVSTVRSGNFLIVSGQISLTDGKPSHIGTLGRNLSLEEGRDAAQAAALGLLAQINAETDGTVASVRRILRLGIFVAATHEFTQHPQVANGASDLVVSVLGDAGKHARTAIGVSSLPSGVSVELDAIIELENAK